MAAFTCRACLILFSRALWRATAQRTVYRQADIYDPSSLLHRGQSLCPARLVVKGAMRGFGALAIFAGMTADLPDIAKKESAFKAAFAVAVILHIVTWAGKYVLEIFGIQTPRQARKSPLH